MMLAADLFICITEISRLNSLVRQKNMKWIQYAVVLTVALMCGCASGRFAKHPGPPRIEINTSGVISVGVDRIAVPVQDVPLYLQDQGVPRGSKVGLAHSGATDRAVVQEFWRTVSNAGWEQGLTIVK